MSKYFQLSISHNSFNLVGQQISQGQRQSKCRTDHGGRMGGEWGVDSNKNINSMKICLFLKCKM